MTARPTPRRCSWAVADALMATWIRIVGLMNDRGADGFRRDSRVQPADTSASENLLYLNDRNPLYLNRASTASGSCEECCDDAMDAEERREKKTGNTAGPARTR